MDVNVKEHWCVKIKGEDRLRGVVITGLDNGWVYMKDTSGTPDALKRGRFSERLHDVEFQTLMKVAS